VAVLNEVISCPEAENSEQSANAEKIAACLIALPSSGE
jgi:hypothetical protein